ncbi:bifunctional 2',3'-cyclic-nucleotide 2'-phosphodiesterase/3'-nucleotidase [Aliidiomarina sp. Khilg15.8]
MQAAKKMILTWAAALSLMLTACAAPVPPEPVQADLRLMQTTDIHAYLLGYDYFADQPTQAYGLARTAALIKQARSEMPNHVLVDNGDLIQGSAMGDWAAARQDPEAVHPAIKVLNHLEYDVGNLGNHEFNYGLEFLQQTIAAANFPYISANVFHARAGESWQHPLVSPYLIKQHSVVAADGSQHSINIGFIGFVPPQIMRWDSQHLVGNLVARDMARAARHYIPKMLAEGADIIVAVPHSGIDPQSAGVEFAEQASLTLAQVEGIDAILFGHQHRLFPGDSAYDAIEGVDNNSGYIHGVPAVQPGYWGSHLGIIDLRLQHFEGKWTVTGSQVENRAVGDDYDHEVVALVADEQRATLAMLNEPLGELEQDINNFFARVHPDSAVQLINEAQLVHGRKLQRLGVLDDKLPLLSAAAPFRNGAQGGADFTHIDAGPLTRGDLSDLYAFPNTVQVVQVNGEQLRDWLEMSARMYQRITMNTDKLQELIQPGVPSFNFDMIAGVTYEILPQHPARFDGDGKLTGRHHHRIYNLRYHGELVRPAQQFLVMTNNYRAGGGGSFPHLDGSTVIYEGQQEVRQLIADYVVQEASGSDASITIEPVEHWRIALPQGARVHFKGSGAEAAISQAKTMRDVEFIEHSDGDYAIFQIKP